MILDPDPDPDPDPLVSLDGLEVELHLWDTAGQVRQYNTVSVVVKF